jgi:hypothetical protein
VFASDIEADVGDVALPHDVLLAFDVRRYYIPDFPNWKNHDVFEREFNRLYESLKAEA